MGSFLGIFGADYEGQLVKTSTMLFAVLFVYVLDFAINVSKCFETILTRACSLLIHVQSKRPFVHTLSMLRQPINKNQQMHG